MENIYYTYAMVFQNKFRNVLWNKQSLFMRSNFFFKFHYFVIPLCFWPETILPALTTHFIYQIWHILTSADCKNRIYSLNLKSCHCWESLNVHPTESKDNANKGAQTVWAMGTWQYCLAPMIITVKRTSFMPINQFEYIVQSISFSKCLTSYVFTWILMRNAKTWIYFFLPFLFPGYSEPIT